MIVHTTQDVFTFMQNKNLPPPKLLGQKAKNKHQGDSNKPPVTERPVTDPGFWIIGAQSKGCQHYVLPKFP